MRTSIPATSDARSAGFTLVELALVLAILAVLASLAVPVVSRISMTSLDAEARRLAAVIAYLHDEAALRGRIYRLTLDLDGRSYGVAVEEPETGEFVSPRSAPGWDPYAPAERLLGDDVRIATVETGSEVHTAGVVTIELLPEDALENLHIELAAGTARRAIYIDGLTGTARIEGAGGA